MSDEKKDFEVKDRRIFSEENREAETAGEKTPAAASTDDQAQASAAAEKAKATETREAPPLPEINFATFVVSLNASALMHLGALEDPTTGQTDKNLPMAKQTIDILSMLEEKTIGNLTDEEKNLLKNVLYDLRIIYVKESR